VMHAVHIGGHKEYPERFIYGSWDVDIAMSEKRAAVQSYFEDQDSEGRGTKDEDSGYFDKHGKYYFYGMEAHSSSHVNVQVCVVHHVQAPKYRYGVERDVLKVDDEIEGNDPDYDCGPSRQMIVIKQPPAVLGGKGGHADRNDGKENSDYYRVQGMHGEIVDPARRLRRC
jgi:hypothetical protein